VNNFKIRFFSNFFFITTLLVMYSSFACYSENATKEIKQVSGYVVDVESLSLKQLKSFELIDQNDSKFIFIVQGDLGKFSPSHMREHMLLGESVIVIYRTENGINIVESVNDLD